MRFLQDPIERLLYVSLAVLMLIIVLSAIGVSVRLHEQNQLIEQVKAQATLVERHTDCVALLLTRQDRGNLHIADLQNCKIAPNQ